MIMSGAKTAALQSGGCSGGGWGEGVRVTMMRRRIMMRREKKRGGGRGRRRR